MQENTKEPSKIQIDGFFFMFLDAEMKDMCMIISSKCIKKQVSFCILCRVDENCIIVYNNTKVFLLEVYLLLERKFEYAY